MRLDTQMQKIGSNLLIKRDCSNDDLNKNVHNNN